MKYVSEQEKLQIHGHKWSSSIIHLIMIQDATEDDIKFLDFHDFELH